MRLHHAKPLRLTTGNNPLIEINEPIPFDIIEPQHYEEAATYHIESLQLKIKALCKLKSSKRTFENTVLALDEALQPLTLLINLLSHLNNVKNSDEHRLEFAKAQSKLTEAITSFNHSEEIYDLILSYSHSDEAKALSGERKRFLEVLLNEYRKNGCHLSGENKRRVTDIEIRLSALTTQFKNNIADSTNEFSILVTDEDQLRGVPEHLQSLYKNAALKADKEGWLISLENSSASIVMTYCDDESIRERVFRAQCSVASSGRYSNREIISEILSLRQEKARILGFDSFADFITSDRMAMSADNALSFLLELKADSRTAFEKEAQDLNQFRKSIEGEDAPECKPWDIAYYAEKLKQKFFFFSPDELRPYLVTQKVFDAFFEIVGELYGVSVKEVDSLPVWSPDVKSYALYGSEHELLGFFYVDIYSRPGEKKGSAWFSSLVTGSRHTPHCGAICANFKAPQDGYPSFLNLNEVKTLFHELGHLMHHFLYNGEMKGLACNKVPWDFIEFPSQIMENWYRRSEVLSRFAQHHETKAVIPFSLLEKVASSRNFRFGAYLQRHLAFSILDLRLHMSESIEDPTSFATDLIQESFPSSLPDDYALLCSMQHLFGHPTGYAAGYYSYLWGEALQAEAFTRFHNEGVFNDEVGHDLKNLLQAGNTEEVAHLFNQFMGRDEQRIAPNGKALLQSYGIYN